MTPRLRRGYSGETGRGRDVDIRSRPGARLRYLPIETRFEIWAPDVYIKNEVLTDVPDEYLVLSVDANGKVMLEREKRLVTKCSMNFRKMPYDIQRCDIVFTLETPGVVLQAAADKLSSKPPGNPECGAGVRRFRIDPGPDASSASSPPATRLRVGGTSRTCTANKLPPRIKKTSSY